MDSRFLLYQRQLERQFIADKDGNLVYFPQGRFGAGYTLPSADLKNKIIQTKMRSSMRNMPYAALMLPLSFAIPSFGKHGLSIFLLLGAALITFLLVRGYLTTRKLIQGLPKSNVKYKTSIQQRAADYADIYTKSQIKAKLMPVPFLVLLGILMCCIGDITMHIIGGLLIILSFVGGYFMFLAIRIKSQQSMPPVI